MAGLWPARPQKGTRLQVLTNCFEITKIPTVEFAQYEAIEPETKIFRLRQEIIHKLQTQYANNFTPQAVYDGKSIMYASHNLGIEGTGKSWTFSMDDKPSPQVEARIQRQELGKGVYRVKISRVNAERIKPTDISKLISRGIETQNSRHESIINLLQLLLTQGTNKKFPNNRRAYFPGPRAHLPANQQARHMANMGHNDISMDLRGTGLELWRGFFASVRPTINRLMVNVDITVAAVYKSGSLLEVAMDYLCMSGPNRDAGHLATKVNSDATARRKLQGFLKGVRVQISYTPGGGRPRTRSIKSIYPDAGNYKFSVDGEQITIAQYTEKAYNRKLLYPKMFGVVVGNTREGDPIIFPAECCSVERGQLYKKTIPSESTKDVVSFATKGPAARLALIQGTPQQQSQAMYEYANSSYLQNAGMTIAPVPARLNGRLLDTPSMDFGSNGTDRPRNGAWNVQNKQLFFPRNLGSWAYVNFCGRGNERMVTEWVAQFVDACQKKGMKISTQPEIINGNNQHVEQAMQQAATMAVDNFSQFSGGKRLEPELIFVFLPEQGGPIRAQVKMWGDSKKHIRTQCLRESKIKKSVSQYPRNDQYHNNVVIKVNGRLGGITAVANTGFLEVLRKEGHFMVIGADASHGGQGSTRPTVTSLIGSWDRELSRYMAVSELQEPRQEMIADMGSMLLRLLKAFYTMHKTLPRKVFVFRDGVSEGELQTIRDKELKLIQGALLKACQDVFGVENPPKIALTLIIVGKRHHVRFFPTNPPAGHDPHKGNCPPGFVADEGLSSVFAKDFFLQSHGAILGTSRPAHYSVLYDDNNYNIDAIQDLSFGLCHCYGNATRSVSIPAPVYYADMVCSRANFYFDENMNFSEDGSTESSTFDLERWKAAYHFPGIEQTATLNFFL